MEVTIRFYGDLNHFLPIELRNQAISYPFQDTPSIKHLIEAGGIPHTEVQSILANHISVDFTYLVKDGDWIEVFPADHQSPPPVDPRFILDNHLGKLATYLRILGFDCIYRNDLQDSELVQISSQNGRILLTRDRRLLMHKVITTGYCIRTLDPNDQLVEVIHRFQLQEKIKPFRRCLRCNSLLVPVSKETILHRLEPLTKLYYEEFHLCTTCDRIYWKGSHYERMCKLIDKAINLG